MNEDDGLAGPDLDHARAEPGIGQLEEARFDLETEAGEKAPFCLFELKCVSLCHARNLTAPHSAGKDEHELSRRVAMAFGIRLPGASPAPDAVQVSQGRVAVPPKGDSPLTCGRNWWNRDISKEAFWHGDRDSTSIAPTT